MRTCLSRDTSGCCGPRHADRRARRNDIKLHRYGHNIKFHVRTLTAIKRMPALHRIMQIFNSCACRQPGPLNNAADLSHDPLRTWFLKCSHTALVTFSKEWRLAYTCWNKIKLDVHHVETLESRSCIGTLSLRKQFGNLILTTSSVLQPKCAWGLSRSPDYCTYQPRCDYPEYQTQPTSSPQHVITTGRTGARSAVLCIAAQACHFRQPRAMPAHQSAGRAQVRKGTGGAPW